MRSQARKWAHLQGSHLEVTPEGYLEAGSWEKIFEQKGALTYEIGLGKDPHLIRRAAAHPEGLHVGLEYSRKKLDKVLYKALVAEVKNLRVVHADAVRVTDPLFGAESLSACYVLFPDPWPKNRHQKKRLVQTEFMRLLTSKLAPGAGLELRTDQEYYRDQMLEVLEGVPGLENRLGPGNASREPLDPDRHIPTLFEEKFLKRGLEIHYLYYRKKGAPPGRDPCPSS
jgi:tRNA (guanine-N7-)-methyltransferase